MGKAIYAIDAFPDDAQLWRIDWIGGVAHNASVPSEPLIDVCLARLPKGETNPLRTCLRMHGVWWWDDSLSERSDGGAVGAD